LAKTKIQYVCRECGYVSPKWMGQCPGCHEWNTLEEREEVKASPAQTVHGGVSGTLPKSELKKLKNVSVTGSERMQTGISELDRVLGGGMVRDSVTILAAKPGAGKSTMLLQIANYLAEQGKELLYVSGEESESQIRRRAERVLTTIGDRISVLSTANMNEVLGAIAQTDPDVIILDSIQTFYLDEFTSRPGSPTQIIECTNTILRLAKDPARPRAVLLAGQLTKDDELAGVRQLEHMVDTVLFMEADPVEEIRTLSSTKNRFGSTGEMGFFTMEENGLMPIENPSRYFMTTREKGSQVTGSALSVMKEGTRPMIIEAESLISQSYTPYPSRISECMNRDQMGTLISILEQRGGITLFDQNVVIKSTGGLKLSSPSVNLAVLLSLASSALKNPIPEDTVFVGDVGLTGELKKVPSIDMMVRETARLGFKQIYLPKDALKEQTKAQLAKEAPGTKLIEGRELSQIIRAVFGDYRRERP